MPSAANNPAPLSAPAIRAVSIVVREMLIAPINWSCGMMVATSAPRTPRSDGRTMPIRAATMKT